MAEQRRKKEIYFTGANSQKHICSCGVSKNCSNKDLACNCDAFDFTGWQEDTGTITNTSALPIRGFVYGQFISEDLVAGINIGRLMCKGARTILPSDINDSCKNLKFNGQSKSQIYPLNGGKLSYCDMSQGINDPDLEHYVGRYETEDTM